MSQLPRPKGGIPVRSGIPQPASRIPQSGIARPIAMAKPTLIGKTVQESIVAHKMKQQNAQIIKQRGTYGNIVRADQLRNAPKVVSTQQVDQNIKDLGTRMKQQKLVGIVKKFGAVPLPNTAFVPAADVQSKLTHQKVLQQVASPNKLHEGQLERQRTEAAKAMKNTFMGTLGISFEDPNVSVTSRDMKVFKKVQELKEGHIFVMCSQYSTLKNSFETMKGPQHKEEKRVMKIKFLENIETELAVFFTMIRMAVGKENFKSYHDDETAKRKFIKMVRDYFANNPDPEKCRKELSRIMAGLPLPVMRVEKPIVEREPMTPLAALKKPISNPALARPTSRLPAPSRLQPPSRMPQPRPAQSQRSIRPPSAPAAAQRSRSPAAPVPTRPTPPRSAESPRPPANVSRQQVRSASPQRPQAMPGRMNKSMTSTPVMSAQGQGRVHQSPVEKIQRNITQGLNELQVMKSRDKNVNKIALKLRNLTNRFCEIYTANHNKTRSAGFEVWKQVFMKNFTPILDDLEAYYEVLPHAASKKFNRDQIAFELHNFLKALFDDTRRLPMSKGDCEKMVSDRIAASAEVARLKKLKEILKDFVENIEELLRPFIPEDDDAEEDDAEQSEEEVVQRAPAPPKQPRPTIEQPRPMVEQPQYQPQPRILQLRAQAAGAKPLLKVPSKTLHRRPLVRPRAAAPELSPIPPPTPQPRRVPERMSLTAKQPKPIVRITPPSREHTKVPPAMVENDRLSPPKLAVQVIPPRTPERVQATDDRLARPSPFNRSYDTTPKFLKDTVIAKGQNKTIAYKPTRLDILKHNRGIDLVQKLSSLEERVQRAVGPTYRPMSPGSPGRDNQPFNRTYTIMADTSFQSRKDEPIQEEDEEEEESFEDEESYGDGSFEDDGDSTIVRLYAKKIDEKWSAIEEHFCAYLTNPKLHHIKIEADIDALITELKEEIIDILYGWNDQVFQDKIESVHEDFLRMNQIMRKCLQRMRTEKISFEDCQDIITGEMEVQGLPETDLRHQLFDAFDHLEYVKDKYRRKIKAGEAQGHLYRIADKIPERVAADAPKVNKQKPFVIRDVDSRKQLSDIREDDTEDDGDATYYYDQQKRPIEIKKRLDAPPRKGEAGPSRFASDQTGVHFPDDIEPSDDQELESESSDSSDEEPRQLKQIPKVTITDAEGNTERWLERKPTEAIPEFVMGIGAPDMLIERDILHVAVQLTERDVSELPLPYDNLVKSILEIAKAYKHGVANKERALELIGQKFWNLACCPIEFTNTFIYHPTNSFFGEMVVNDPATNAAIRANLMSERNLRQCEDANIDASNIGLDFSVYADQTWFNIFKEDEADDVARELENSIKEDTGDDLDLSLGDVSIHGYELSNSGDEFLAIPSSINYSYESSVVTDDEQMSLLKFGGVPDQKVTMETLKAEVADLDRLMDIQFGEGQKHLDNSAIHKKGIKCILHPTILERHNYWQARGGDFPNWFPGMYTVFQDSFELKPFVHNDVNNVFVHAWRTMAPHIDTRTS